jgi:ESCRT-I complex subunit TSG101
VSWKICEASVRKFHESTLSCRLLNAYAEEAATEDAIYYMGEALRSGVIDLEVFMKHVRQLSRKQFMLRALMQKCRQKAGLAG